MADPTKRDFSQWKSTTRDFITHEQTAELFAEHRQPSKPPGAVAVDGYERHLADVAAQYLATNDVLVLGDTAHGYWGFRKALASPEMMNALKKAGCTHACLEITPAELSRLRNYAPPSDDEGFRDFEILAANGGAHTLRGARPVSSQMVAALDAAGIEIIPMDVIGAGSAAGLLELTGSEAGRHPGPSALDPSALAESATEQPGIAPNIRNSLAFRSLLEERRDVTAAVWVPRVKEALDGQKVGKVLVFAGDGHVDNSFGQELAAPARSDLDELLSYNLAKSVAYVRLMRPDLSQTEYRSMEDTARDKSDATYFVLGGGTAVTESEKFQPEDEATRIGQYLRQTGMLKSTDLPEIDGNITPTPSDAALPSTKGPLGFAR